MKSKIYSSRYMKVTSKGLVWIPAFVTIGFLLAFPVAELIMLGNWFGMEYTAREINALYANLWQNGFMITGLAVAALAALFNGISQFWYLYSPRKIDFYHSLPVKRNRMFWYKTLQSLLYFLVPYYPATGRLSVDPDSMFKLLLIGHLYGIKSERRLVENVQLNIAYLRACHKSAVLCGTASLHPL